MDKVKSKLNALLTVFTVLCVALCLFLSVQVIAGKDASIFGFRIYHILTGSMEPTIATGANVISRQVDPDTLEVGDIITFTSRDNAIYGAANTHRIIEITVDSDGRKCFITKGDANNIEDSLQVYPEEIRGKVVFYLSASANMFLGFLQTKLGFALVIVFPLMIVIWWFMKDLKKQVSEMAAEAAEEELREEEPEPEESRKTEETEDLQEEIATEMKGNIEA